MLIVWSFLTFSPSVPIIHHSCQEAHNNIRCCFEQIQEAKHHERPAVRPLTANPTQHTRNTNKTF